MICAVLILLSYSNPSFLGKLQINSCLNYSCLHAEDLSHGKTLITTTDMLFLSIKPTTLQVHKMDKHEPFVTPSHAHTPVSQGTTKKNKHDKSYTRFQWVSGEGFQAHDGRSPEEILVDYMADPESYQKWNNSSNKLGVIAQYMLPFLECHGIPCKLLMPMAVNGQVSGALIRDVLD